MSNALEIISGVVDSALSDYERDVAYWLKEHATRPKDPSNARGFCKTCS